MSSTSVTFVVKPCAWRCLTQLAQHPQVGLLNTSTVGMVDRWAATRPPSDTRPVRTIAVNTFFISLFSPTRLDPCGFRRQAEDADLPAAAGSHDQPSRP